MLERIKPTLIMNADIFTNGEVYNCTEFNTPFITTENLGDEMSLDQAMFKALTNKVMKTRQKGAHCKEPLRLRQDDIPPASRQDTQARSSSVSSRHASPSGS